MAEKRVSVRFSAVGGDQLKAELTAVGREGRAALRAIDASAAPASDGLQNVSNQAGATVVALENLSARAQRVAQNLRAAGASTGTLVDRINQVTGVSPSVSRSADDIAAYGRALDDTRAKFNPMFAVIRQYRAQLEEIRQAHRVGAISADEMTQAIQRERQAALASIAAIKGRTTSITQMSMATGLAAHRMRNLAFQVNDIGVSLAGGMNPFVVLAQQGTQIAQIYGFGGGGVNGLMRDLGRMIAAPITRFPVLTAAVVATGAALAGMTHQINEATGASVTMGDTAMAAVEVVWRSVNDTLRPAIEAIAPWFQAAWDGVVTGVRWATNLIINAFRAAFADIRFIWQNFPDIIGAAAVGAANAVIRAINSMVNAGLEGINRLIRVINSVASTLGAERAAEWLGLGGDGQIDEFAPWEGIAEIENEFAERLRRPVAERNARIAEIMASDPLGEFFDAVKVEAVNNALERTAKAAEGAGAAGRAAGKDLADAADEAASGWGKSAATLQEYAAEAMDLAGSIGEAIVRAFQSAENAVVDFVKTGKLNFSDMITSFIADLARLAVRRFILGPIAGALSGVLGSFGLPGLAAVSYDGGGHTGYGPRTGGLDGKGGFLAMVHPQERIIDERRGENRGRQGGGDVYVTIQARDVDSFRQSRTQVAADIARAVSLGRRGL